MPDVTVKSDFVSGLTLTLVQTQPRTSDLPLELNLSIKSPPVKKLRVHQMTTSRHLVLNTGRTWVNVMSLPADAQGHPVLLMVMLTPMQEPMLY